MKMTQRALCQPLSLWSRKMSLKIEKITMM